MWRARGVLRKTTLSSFLRDPTRASLARSSDSRSLLAIARAALLIGLLSASSAGAALPRVALWVSGPSDRDRVELETRLRAELAIAGFESVALDAFAESDRASLERAARASGSFAAIAVVRRGKLNAEVWVADRVTGKTVLRTVRFD